MKNTIKLVSAIAVCLLLTGCSDTPTIYNNPDYRGEPIKVTEGVYFKKVYIQGMYALLQCDKDGNIIPNQNLNTGYQNGKVFESTSILSVSHLTPDSVQTNSDRPNKFVFKCSELDDCLNQISVVKNSLIQSIPSKPSIK